jgi:hypothetical protein
VRPESALPSVTVTDTTALGADACNACFVSGPADDDVIVSGESPQLTIKLAAAAKNKAFRILPSFSGCFPIAVNILKLCDPALGSLTKV